MTLRKCVIDADLLSQYMRRNPRTVRAVERYVEQHDRLSLSIVTRFEVLKGLKHLDAKRQMSDFKALCDESETLPLTEEVVEVAAEVYSDLRRRGETIQDPNILVAATALHHELAVAANNVRHFQRVSGWQL